MKWYGDWEKCGRSELIGETEIRLFYIGDRNRELYWFRDQSQVSIPSGLQIRRSPSLQNDECSPGKISKSLTTLIFIFASVACSIYHLLHLQLFYDHIKFIHLRENSNVHKHSLPASVEQCNTQRKSRWIRHSIDSNESVVDEFLKIFSIPVEYSDAENADACDFSQWLRRGTSSHWKHSFWHSNARCTNEKGYVKPDAAYSSLKGIIYQHIWYAPGRVKPDGGTLPALSLSLRPSFHRNNMLIARRRSLKSAPINSPDFLT